MFPAYSLKDFFQASRQVSYFRLWLLATSLLMSLQVDAGIVFDNNYVQVRTQLTAGTGSGSGNDSIQTGNSSVDTGLLEVDNGSWSAEGRSAASVSTGSALRGFSSSTAPDAVGIISNSSISSARASWRDVLTPTSADSSASLNFNFSVHAVLSVTQTQDSGILGNPNFSSASISVSANSSIVSFLVPTSAGLSATLESFNGGLAAVSLNETASMLWNSTSITDLGNNTFDFDGSFTLTTNRIDFVPSEPDAPFGAYFLGVAINASTSNKGGTSTSDAFSTLTLSSITDELGQQISSEHYVFESGSALTSVPVPAAAWFYASAFLSLACARTKRVRR